MNFSVQQSALNKALSIVTKAVNSRSTLPVLGNVAIYADDDGVRLSATDLNVGITLWIPATVDDVGAITLPARLLGEFVNSLPDALVKLNLLTKTMTAALSCGRTQANINGIDAAEYPLLAEKIDDVTAVMISASTLRNMVDAVLFAAATDVSRPTLTGVKIDLQHGQLKLAATDGYRLAVATETVETDAELSAIVPASALSTMSGILADADTVRIWVDDGRRIIVEAAAGDKAKWRHACVEMSLIEAKYPDYSAIIPKRANVKATVNVDALSKAVRVAQLFGRDNSNIVRMNAGDGRMVISATSAESGDNTSELAAEVSGDGIEIAMNSRYILDMLGQLDVTDVTLEMTQPNRPLKVKTDGRLYVIMPMHPPRL